MVKCGKYGEKMCFRYLQVPKIQPFWNILDHLKNQILKYLTVSPLRRINTFRDHISNMTCVDLLELERVFTGYINVSN